MKFTKHAYHRKKRLKPRWRRPRGLHNKQRLEHKSSTPRVKVGYRTAKATRGKKRGLDIVHVYNAQDVQAVDAKTQGVVIGKIGTKKKLELLKLIHEKKLTLLTGDAQEQLTALKQRYEERKKSREQKREEREGRQEELEKEAEDADEQEEASTPLSKVKGVGPSTIKKLEEADISSAEELAEMSAQELVEKSDVSETNAKKIIEAANNATRSAEEQEKDKVLTKAR